MISVWVLEETEESVRLPDDEVEEVSTLPESVPAVVPRVASVLVLEESELVEPVSVALPVALSVALPVAESVAESVPPLALPVALLSESPVLEESELVEPVAVMLPVAESVPPLALPVALPGRPSVPELESVVAVLVFVPVTGLPVFDASDPVFVSVVDAPVVELIDASLTVLDAPEAFPVLLVELLSAEPVSVILESVVV